MTNLSFASVTACAGRSIEDSPIADSESWSSRNRFFAKGWPNYELDGLVTRAVSGEQLLLPVWHNVSKEEVIRYSPSLADKLARNTAMHTVVEIATEIAAVITGTTEESAA